MPPKSITPIFVSVYISARLFKFAYACPPELIAYPALLLDAFISSYLHELLFETTIRNKKNLLEPNRLCTIIVALHT